jgi:glycosyltransferase involved in cell wall biosynthesis
MSPVATRVSVIVCTHNPRPDYLARVLVALQKQTLPLTEWELLLIDNASSEPLADRFDLTWTPNARIVCEEELGLSHARARGVKEAKGEIVIFCDDDNCLAPDYCALAWEFFQGHPDCAMLGGRGVPEIEGEKPTWFDKVQQSYAVGEPYPGEQDVTDEYSKLWGAGVVIRRAALQSLFSSGFKNQLTDRRGRQVVSGGDHELFIALRMQGWRMWYSPRLVFRHLISARRCQWQWYLAFLRGCARNSFLFDPYERVHEAAPRSAIEFLKGGALYQIYLSTRILLRTPKPLKCLFAQLTPDANVDQVRAFYHRNRIAGFLCWGMIGYRRRLREMKQASWLSIPSECR